MRHFRVSGPNIKGQYSVREGAAYVIASFDTREEAERYAAEQTQKWLDADANKSWPING